MTAVAAMKQNSSSSTTGPEFHCSINFEVHKLHISRAMTSEVGFHSQQEFFKNLLSKFLIRK